MRLWTLHPRHLDARGLVALWREALLAQKVLQGATRGYQQHPQLIRFRSATDPLAAIATYLAGVHEEAKRRGYRFDAGKIAGARSFGPLEVKQGQLLYEWRHLQQKLKRRDPDRYRACRSIKVPQAHPLFRVVPGDIEAWERVTEGG